MLSQSETKNITVFNFAKNFIDADVMIKFTFQYVAHCTLQDLYTMPLAEDDSVLH